MYTITTKNNNKRGANSPVSQNKPAVTKPKGKNLDNTELDSIKEKIKKLERTMNNQLNASVNKLNLSSDQSALVKEYAKELLHPTKGIDIPRPFPVMTNRAFFAGQLILESEARDIMFQIKPDPFRFITITENTPTAIDGTGSLPTVNYNEAGADDVGNVSSVGSGPIMIGYPSNLPLVTGGSVPNISNVALSGSGSLSTVTRFVSLISDNFRAGFIQGWKNVGAIAQTASVVISNGGQGNFSCQMVLFTRGANGVVTPSSVSLLTAVNAGSTVAIAIPIITISTDEITTLGLGLRLEGFTVAPTAWEDITVTPQVLGIKANADHISVRSLTVGQASYPGDVVNADRVDQLFLNSQLYAPVACSSVLNVTQLLKDRGGNFLSAYMPSRVKLPATPEQAWMTANSYRRSYPVAMNPFAKGCHGSWIGQRIQDYEFRRPFREESWSNLNYDSLPSTYLIGQRAVADTPSIATYYLDFNVGFSIQTLDPTITLQVTPSCPNFLLLYLSIVAMHPLLVGENPNHIARLAEIAKMVANDPRVQQLVKFGLSKGLPLLLGALA